MMSEAGLTNYPPSLARLGVHQNQSAMSQHDHLPDRICFWHHGHSPPQVLPQGGHTPHQQLLCSDLDALAVLAGVGSWNICLLLRPCWGHEQSWQESPAVNMPVHAKDAPCQAAFPWHTWKLMTMLHATWLLLRHQQSSVLHQVVLP
jgi:hypothetical protein